MFNRPMNNFQGGMQQPARFPQHGGMGQQFPHQGFRPQQPQFQFPQGGMGHQPQFHPAQGFGRQMPPTEGLRRDNSLPQPSPQNPPRPVMPQAMQLNPQMMQQLQQGANTLSGPQQMPQAFNTMMPNNPFAGLNGFGGGY